MKVGKKVAIGLTSLALVAGGASFSFGAKAIIDDEEMDLVTAAGQPTIVQAESIDGDAVATQVNDSSITASIDTASQSELTALTLNNVFGENQVANGTNIQGAEVGVDASQGELSSQDNTILQSWGSTKDLDVVATEGSTAATAAAGNATATQTATSTATATSANTSTGGNNATTSTQNGGDRAINRDTNDATQTTTSNATSTTTATATSTNGNATATGGSAAASAVNGTLHTLLTAHADVIVHAESTGGDAVATATDTGSLTADIFDGSQSNLTALTVNNVFGLNQVANGLNIASSIGEGVAIEGGGFANQSNDIAQWRGTPAGWDNRTLASASSNISQSTATGTQ